MASSSNIPETFRILQDPENGFAARTAFITGAGVLGYALGAIRGRMFRRLAYAGIGVGASGAICYPEEASKLARDGAEESRRYALIAYNFVNGGMYYFPDPTYNPREII